MVGVNHCVLCAGKIAFKCSADLGRVARHARRRYIAILATVRRRLHKQVGSATDGGAGADASAISPEWSFFATSGRRRSTASMGVWATGAHPQRLKDAIGDDRPQDLNGADVEVAGALH
jgi:hypothetical protein